MADKLTNLMREGKIDKYEFDTYLMFGADDLGRSYLKNMLDAIVLEEPVSGRGTDYAKVDGRRSVWRNIKLVIDKLNFLLEGNQNVINGNLNGNNFDSSSAPRPIYEFHPPADR